MIVFLDTEFTALIEPELLSIGLVSLDGQELYVELDLSDEAGQKTLSKASEFVRDNGVIGQWGKVPSATATASVIGRRTGEWLLSLAGDSSQHIEVVYDYTEDFQLLAKSIPTRQESARSAVSMICSVNTIPSAKRTTTTCPRRYTRSTRSTSEISFPPATIATAATKRAKTLPIHRKTQQGQLSAERSFTLIQKHPMPSSCW